MANKDIINTLLSKLKTDVHLGEEDLRFPLNRDFDLMSANSCFEVISNYCVGARFRLFCGALEHIKGCTEEDNPLLAALKQSVILHQSRLRQLLLERLPQHVPIADNVIIVSEERSKLLRCLRDVFFAAKMSNGAMFLSSDVNFDLTLLGIASRRELAGVYEDYEELINYSAVEVLEVLMVHFKDEIETLKIQLYMGLLDKVLAEYGHKVQFKGNFIETIVLESFRKSLVAKQKLEDLPCLNEVDLGIWKSVCLPPFIGENVVSSSEIEDLPGYLGAVDNHGTLVSPDLLCRPDGILMLNPDRAIVIGCAVYRGSVPKQKSVDQLKSTSMRDCYLTKEGKNSRKTKRDRWEEEGLHNTKAIRVCVNFPKPSMDLTNEPYKQLSEEAKDKGDIIVNIDARTASKLMGVLDRDLVSFWR